MPKSYFIESLLSFALLVAMAVLAGIAMATPSWAQVSNCGPSLAVYDALEEKYGESRVMSGLDADGILWEVWVNPDSGTWTLLSSDAGGTSCVQKSGEEHILDS